MLAREDFGRVALLDVFVFSLWFFIGVPVAVAAKRIPTFVCRLLASTTGIG